MKRFKLEIGAKAKKLPKFKKLKEEKPKKVKKKKLIYAGHLIDLEEAKRILTGWELMYANNKRDIYLMKIAEISELILEFESE